MRPASPLRVTTVIPALPRAVIVNVSPMNILSIWKTLVWYLEWKIIPGSFGRGVDSLELFVDKVATRSGEESAVTTQRLDSPILAHDMNCFGCMM
jgi:hypothetical protein